jgi:hypothetical protein
VAGTVDVMEDISTVTIADARARLEDLAKQRAIASGADPSTVYIVESEAIPIAYTPGRCRFVIKAVGEWADVAGEDKDRSRVNELDADEDATVLDAPNGVTEKTVFPELAVVSAAELLAYKPKIVNHEWYLSERDLDWIAAGCECLFIFFPSQRL